MTDAGDGRRVSDVPPAPGRQVPDTHRAGMPSLPGHRGLDTPFPFTLTLPQWGTEHALAVYLVGTDGAHSMARKAAGISGIGFGAPSPSWLARTSDAGRRDAASLARNWLPRAPSARTHMQRTASRSSRP